MNDKPIKKVSSPSPQRKKPAKTKTIRIFSDDSDIDEDAMNISGNDSELEALLNSDPDDEGDTK